MRIKFIVRALTHWGDTVCIVGNVPELGNWNPYCGVRMNTNRNTYPIWESEYVNIMLKGKLEYKYVVLKGDGSMYWEAEFSLVNRVIYPELLKEFRVVKFDDDAFSSVRAVRRLEAVIDILPTQIKEEDSKIKLMGRHGGGDLFYVNMKTKSYNGFHNLATGRGDIMRNSLWIQVRGNIFAIGGLNTHIPQKTTYKLSYDTLMFTENNRTDKAITVSYMEMAPMIKARNQHCGILVNNEYIYVIGGNQDNTAEKYNVEKNKWISIPSNTKNFSRGTLTVIDKRYLFVVKEEVVGANIPTKVHAERLDLLDEESGWQPFDLNISKFHLEPHALLIEEAGNGKLSILTTHTNRPPSIILFSMDKNKIVNENNLVYMNMQSNFMEYENGHVKWYYISGSVLLSLHHKLAKGCKIMPAQTNFKYEYNPTDAYNVIKIISSPV